MTWNKNFSFCAIGKQISWWVGRRCDGWCDRYSRGWPCWEWWRSCIGEPAAYTEIITRWSWKPDATITISNSDGTATPVSWPCKIVEKKLDLRKGQANDALQKVRECLSHLAWQYKAQVRVAKSTKQTTKSWGGVTALGRELRLHRRIYNHSRHIMIQLASLQEVDNDFPFLTWEDCCASEVIINPNAKGMRNIGLAWFWGKVDSAVGPDAYMQECGSCCLIFWISSQLHWLVYRLHWLRAWARFNRWTEELLLTKYEMKWTVRYNMRMVRSWRRRAELLTMTAGQKAYAEEQAGMWNELVKDAEETFCKNNATHERIWVTIWYIHVLLIGVLFAIRFDCHHFNHIMSWSRFGADFTAW